MSHTGKGEKLSSSQAVPGQAIKSAGVRFTRPKFTPEKTLENQLENPLKNQLEHTERCKFVRAKLRESFWPAAASHSQPRQAGA